MHGKRLTENDGCFIIIKVFQTATYWPDFDCEEHLNGSILMWQLSNTKKLNWLDKSEATSNCPMHSETPVPLERRKRKRNSDLWLANVKKKARNEGKEYQYKTKSGERKTMPKCKMKESCHCSCRKKCSTHFSPDDRNIIFSHYWKL